MRQQPQPDSSSGRAPARDGADGWHLLERDMPEPAPAGRRQPRGRPKPADAQPSRVRARGNASAAARQRRPKRLGGDDRQPSAPGRGEILVRVQACDLSNVDPALSTGATPRRVARGARGVCGLDAAGTVIATGDRVTRFAAGDEVFGHFTTESGAWAEAPLVRAGADGPNVELRPEALDPLAAAALARSGLTAKTILRAAELEPDQTALVIGATSGTGTMLLSLLDEAGAKVIDTANDTTESTTGDPVVDALTFHPDLDLLVDLVSWGEPYFITATATQGTIVSARRPPDGPGVRRIGISAERGDLATLAKRALEDRQPVDTAHVQRLELATSA